MTQESDDEIKRLKAFINDLIGVVAIPAIWSGGEASQAVRTLLDVLFVMLSLDVAYVRLYDEAGETHADIVRVAESRGSTTRTREIGGVLDRWLGDDLRAKWPAQAALSIEGHDMMLLPLRLGLQAEFGAIVVGSHRPDFPTQTEKLLLSVATNQAAVGLHDARLLREQKRVADELDRRVEQRTKELAAANDTLRREIVERRMAEEKLRHEEQELKRTEAFLMEAERLSATGSFSLNPATGAIWWSAETYRIFELDPTIPPTFAGIRERIHPDDVDLFDQAWASAQRGDGVSLAMRLLAADGAVKHLQVVAHVTDATGAEPFEYVGAVRDTTAQRQSEEALTKARADLAHMARVLSLSELTASIAHEVNQPLTGILTNASVSLRMLDAQPANIDDAREAIRRTLRDGNRAADVIAKLRALFVHREFVLEALDLNEATREVIALTLSDLQRNQVVLQSDLEEDLPIVTGDRVQLQQVILNLLRNASDAMATVHDRPRQLLIKTEREADRHVRVTVQDAGVGLDRQSKDKLFDAFYTTKRDGMGIGLSISRSIIESHHGRIWGSSNEGSGATFAFSIPAA